MCKVVQQFVLASSENMLFCLKECRITIPKDSIKTGGFLHSKVCRCRSRNAFLKLNNYLLDENSESSILFLECFRDLRTVRHFNTLNLFSKTRVRAEDNFIQKVEPFKAIIRGKFVSSYG